MRNVKKKILICTLAVASVVASSAVTYAETVGFGTTLPSSGYDRTCTAKKISSQDNIMLNVTETGNGNKYNFWCFQDGDSPSNRITSEAEAEGPGHKTTDFGGAGGRYYNKRVGLVIKTGFWVTTPMWIAGQYSPN